MLKTWKLCPRPELTLILFPTNDGLLRLREGGRTSYVAVALKGARSPLPMPCLELTDELLDPAHVIGLVERVRELRS